MRFTVHAAKIPERFEGLSPEARRLYGAYYVNACDDRRWHPAPDALHEPWTVVPCEVCKRIIDSQPSRINTRAPFRP